MKYFFGLIMTTGLCVAFLWLLVTSCTAPPPEITPGSRLVQMGHDNYIRNVTYYIPKKLRKRRRSLVMCLHSGGSSGDDITRLTRRNFNKLAESNNFIVAYPEALNNYWNDAREDSISLSHHLNIDDVGFIGKVIDFAMDSFRVDPQHIFVSGFSEGGFMVFRLACEIPAKIQGFATVAAAMPLDQLVECAPDTTISLMMINGTRDPILPFEGGQMVINEMEKGSILSAEATADYWREINGCSEKSSLRDVPNRDTFDETRSERITWDDCKNKNKIVQIQVINGGHAWPGGRQYLNEKNAGKVARDFEAADEIWKFFRSL